MRPSPHLAIVGAALAAACMAASERSEPRLSAPARAALAALRAETTFASARVGVVGAPSAQARWLRRLLAEREAHRALDALWRDGHPAGRLYALIGYALTDTAAFAHRAPALRGDRTRMPTVMGCIGSEAAAGDLATRLVPDSLAAAFRPDPETARADSLMDRYERSRAPAS